MFYAGGGMGVLAKASPPKARKAWYPHASAESLQNSGLKQKEFFSLKSHRPNTRFARYIFSSQPVVY